LLEVEIRSTQSLRTGAIKIICGEEDKKEEDL
jgi:hypothetical protein